MTAEPEAEALVKIGLLADVHEEVERLREAVAALRGRGAERFVVLGDVFERGRRLAETVAVLAGLDSVGVWGNHDFGLCRDVPASVRRRFPDEVFAYFATLRPRVEVDGCLFQHIEPHLDPEKLEDLWSYGGDGVLTPADAFAAVPHRRIFVGHVHRWRLHSPEGPVPWDGTSRVTLDPGLRYLVAVHAVQQGWCALYDSAREEVEPIRAEQPAPGP